MVLAISSNKPGSRQIRVHTKSRQGCGNCKLRKIKCDESKPKCKNCTTYGVLCNYDGKHPDLQLSVSGAFHVEVQQRFDKSLKQSIPRMYHPSQREPSQGVERYQLAVGDLELLSNFRSRTVFTISTDISRPVYQNEVIKLASLHPFLMHAILTFTLMHDRYLSRIPEQSPAEVSHWYESAGLFNRKLSKPVQASDRVALWVTATLLALITYSHIEAETPEDAWPLNPCCPSSLDWVRMTDGKREVLSATQSLGGDHIIQALTAVYNHSSTTCYLTAAELENLPPEFVKLYGLNDASNIDENPYYIAAATLAHSLYTGGIMSTVLNFISFVSYMQPDYKELLRQKEPRALLLLACWYAKACQAQLWWIWRRSSLEGQAICLYLERYHSQDVDIQNLLPFPKVICTTVAG